MKQITDTFEDKLLSLYLEESLMSYVSMYIKSYYGYDRCVYESDIFMENIGEFPRRTEISEKIYDRILKKKEKKFELDCRQYDTFFDKLNIEIGDSDVFEFAYIKQDFENKIIYIELNFPKNIDDDYLEYRSSCTALIGHELNHAYEDYNRHEHNVKTLDRLIDRGYTNARRYLFSQNNDLRKISKMLYYLNDQERNAYFSQLKNDVKDIVKSHNWNQNNIKYTTLVNELKSKKLWKEYFEIGQIIVVLHSNGLNSEEENEIVKNYNMFNKTKLTNKEVKDVLYKKWLKFKKKFEQLVPKACVENLKITYTFI